MKYIYLLDGKDVINVAAFINDLLNKAELQTFIGREDELQLMQNQLDQDRTDWNLLHFHGISGIGKTALLKRFMNISSTANIIYINTDKELHSPQQFLDIIVNKLHNHPYYNKERKIGTEQSTTTSYIVNSLNTIATTEPPLILLFDSFELWEPIMDWLFDSFIPKLSANIRIISAGRDSLRSIQTRSSSWSLLVHHVHLQPLSKSLVHEYLKNNGIHDLILRNTIVKLSDGIPFSMNLCYKMAIENGERLETANLKQIVRILCQSVLDELDITIKQRSLLDAASVVQQFDKELLTNITGQSLSYEEFDQFCDLPIILKAKDGWSLVDGIRNWFQTDFKEHSPELFDNYKKRALEVLYRRWTAANPLQRRSLFLENVFTAKNELLQEFYFLNDETVYDIRTAEQQDIATIMEIWRNRHLNSLQSVNDGTEQEKLIQEVWELEPSAIKAFWENDCIVGFTAIVSLTREARKIFLKNDLYRNYLLQTKPEENERLFWIGATAKNNDYQALNAIYRYFFEHFMDNYLCTVMFPTDYDVSGLLSLGLKELPWAASVTPSGKKFRMLQVDLREVSLLKVLTTSKLLTTSYPIKTKKVISVQEMTQLLKKLLPSYHELESMPELLKEANEVMNIEMKDNEAYGDTIRHFIKEAMNGIEIKTEKDRLMVRSIELSYIDQIGTNELVAERLHLSISTYYRYLNRGIEKLALQFIN